MQRLIFSALCAVLLAACQTTSTTKDAGAPVEERTPSTGAAGTATTGTSTTAISGNPTGTTGAGNPLKDPSSPLSKRIVYFEFDSYVVKDEYKPMIEAHGRYLQANRGARMTIQGSTDERGSREYNIALGQRRADGVRQMMVLLGVQEGQIETVSFGEEKPRSNGKDEAAFSENRRSDIVYDGE